MVDDPKIECASTRGTHASFCISWSAFQVTELALALHQSHEPGVKADWADYAKRSLQGYASALCNGWTES